MSYVLCKFSLVAQWVLEILITEEELFGGVQALAKGKKPKYG